MTEQNINNLDPELVNQCFAKGKKLKYKLTESDNSLTTEVWCE